MDMTITIEMITMVVTAIITAIFGELAKRFNWIEKKYLPFQNLCIGLFIGIIAYLVGLNTNLLSAVLYGIFASMTAGGMYDLSKTSKEE